jgi:hypothetical protein
MYHVRFCIILPLRYKRRVARKPQQKPTQIGDFVSCMEVSAMSTETQINANRLNAQKSTGPKTPEGKEKVSQNAVTHGLTAARPILMTEDPDQYDRLRDDIFRQYAPVGTYETSLTERAVNTFWRLQRASTFEIFITDSLLMQAKSASDGIGSVTDGVLLAAAVEHDFSKERVLQRIQRYELNIERSYFRTLKELRQLQSQRLNAAEASGLGSSSENSKNTQNKPKAAEAPGFDPSEKRVNAKNKPIFKTLPPSDLSEMNTLAPDILKGLMKNSHGLPKMLTMAM